MREMTSTYPESKRAPTAVISSSQKLVSCIDQELEPSEWHEVDQSRIDRFADATGDHQWIHVDPRRAAFGPFGTTIAQGYLTLSLLPLLMAEVIDFDGATMTVNYGLNKVRFPAPVPAGAQVRAIVTVTSVVDVEAGAQVSFRVIVECAGSPKPVCIAEPVWLVAFG